VVRGYCCSQTDFLPTPITTVVDQNTFFPFDGPSWSLFFELAANALHAWLAPALTTKRLTIVIGFSLIILICAGIRVGSLDLGWWPRPVSFLGGFPRVFFSYFLGVLAYRIYRTGIITIRLHPVLIILLMVICFSIPGKEGSYYRLALDTVLVVFCFPLIVYVASQNEISGIIERFLLPLGVTSYAIYILHFPLKILFGVDHLSLLPSLIFLASIVGASLVLDRFYDRPVRLALTRWLSFTTASKQKPATHALQMSGNQNDILAPFQSGLDDVSIGAQQIISKY
jgi:peptidoglycan/LPS O-acetylase OafA/YrhL